MKDLAEHIEYLLLQQNVVNLPGLGRLIVKVLPAHYSEEDFTFLPPSRNLLFEADTQAEDNGIQALLMRMHHLSADMARALVTNYVADLRDNLLSLGEAELGSIGQFLQEDGGIVTFSPCEAGITSPEFFALDIVEARPLPESDIKARIIDDMENEYITIRLSRKAVRRTLRVAAALLVAFILIVPGVQLCQQYDVPSRLEAGVSTFYKAMLVPRQEAELQEPVAVAEPAPAAKSHKRPATQKPLSEQPLPKAERPAQQQPEAIAEPAPAKVTAAPVESKPEGAYCIVMASSTTENHAEAYIKTLNKMGVTGAVAISERNGQMKRVILPGFATEEDAIIKARELRDKYEDFYDIWTSKL